MRVQQRPTAAILQDPYAGFRDWFTGEPVGDPVWSDWDFACLWAFQTIEDYTDGETGHLVWVEQSDRVTFDAKRYIKKSIAAVERKTKGSKNKAYKAQDGERWRTIPRVMGGGEMPTLVEWLEQEQKKQDRSE